MPLLWSPTSSPYAATTTHRSRTTKSNDEQKNHGNKTKPHYHHEKEKMMMADAIRIKISFHPPPKIPTYTIQTRRGCRCGVPCLYRRYVPRRTGFDGDGPRSSIMTAGQGGGGKDGTRRRNPRSQGHNVRRRETLPFHLESREKIIDGGCSWPLKREKTGNGKKDRFLAKVEALVIVEYAHTANDMWKQKCKWIRV